MDMPEAHTRQMHGRNRDFPCLLHASRRVSDISTGFAPAIKAFTPAVASAGGTFFCIPRVLNHIYTPRGVPLPLCGFCAGEGRLVRGEIGDHRAKLLKFSPFRQGPTLKLVEHSLSTSTRDKALARAATSCQTAATVRVQFFCHIFHKGRTYCGRRLRLLIAAI